MFPAINTRLPNIIITSGNPNIMDQLAKTTGNIPGKGRRMKLDITLFGALPFRRISKTAKRQRRTHLKKEVGALSNEVKEKDEEIKKYESDKDLIFNTNATKDVVSKVLVDVVPTAITLWPSLLALFILSASSLEVK